MRENDLMIIERCIENKNEKLDVKEEPFEKLMFFYKSALKQLELQMNIIKDEFKLIYNYDLIDHIDTRIKEPKSIVKKMEKKKYILEEGIVVPFLQDLGVMTQDGKIVRTKMDKFRQINKYLEFIVLCLHNLTFQIHNAQIDQKRNLVPFVQNIFFLTVMA